MDDAQHLFARRMRSRKTVVVGGGLLGLEIAYAMMRENTDVAVVDHASIVMANQLDEAAANLLHTHILQLGIELYLGSGISHFDGDDAVSAVVLRDGGRIECDTVILATGIQPNTRLAIDARLTIRSGIRVNDDMTTSDPDIYAIGECAEHNGKIYGIVKPGYEQAGVAAHNLCGKQTFYKGSETATKLKVLGIDVTSMGDISEVAASDLRREYIFEDKQQGIYRRLIVKFHRLVGVISVGDWPELGRVQEAISNRRLIMFWNFRRFNNSGELWGRNTADDIAQWPASTKICNCNQVSRGDISKVLISGVNSVKEVTERTGAGAVCGGCKPLLEKILKSDTKPQPLVYYRAIFLSALLAFVVVSIALLTGPLPFNYSAEQVFQWDMFWRDNLYKQISGFSLLFISLLLGLVSLRKRVKKINLFGFDGWRLFHIVAGVFGVVLLAVHSGFSTGVNLNLYLFAGFVGLIITGAASGLVMSIQHRLDMARARVLKNTLQWLHIVLIWPLPVLLISHIVKSYYF